ncbi:TolC family protein [Sediminicola luteus]|nr:TolC family protein [Sediminicola luteus]
MKSKKMNLSYRIATIVMVLFVVTAQAQTQEGYLSKEDAIKLALEENFGIKIARNRVEIAKNNKSVLNSGYLPTLTGTAGATYSESNTTTSFPDGDRDGNPTPDVELNGAESQVYNGGVNLNYTLFDGLGRYYNYKSLKEQYDLSELQARETIENTMLQLFSVYFEVARITENQVVLDEAMQISTDRVTRAEYAFEYGQNSKLDVLNARVDATNDSILYMNSKQSLANAKRDLNVVLNQELTTLFTVDTTVNFTPMDQIEAYYEKVKDHNVTLLQNERNLAINAYDVKISRSGYLPSIGLTGSYGWNLNQNPASAFFPSQNQTRDNLQLGAALTWNLFDGGRTTTRVKNAKIALANQELTRSQLELEIERDIRNALEIYKNRLQVFKIQEQNVVTNQHNFNRSTAQFQLGRITSLEFRQAQTNLLLAQTNRNAAKYDAKLAELQLMQLLGQLLNIPY